MQAQPSPPEKRESGGLGRLVVRNTFYLTASQAITIPLSVLMNAMMARHLGPQEFGYIYFAVTICGFAFLAVDWGNAGSLPALVARDRESAGILLGTSFAWRTVLSVVVYLVVATASYAFGYRGEFQWALGLTFLGSSLTSYVAGCKDTIRGFERTDIPAYIHVGQQLVSVLLVCGALALGAGLRITLTVQAVVVAATLLVAWRTLRPVGVGRLTFSRGALSSLLSQGTPFVFFGLAMALQPSIDAVYLSKLAPPEVMGWFAAARRLIGVLLFPASAMIGALYPTLCRLYTADRENFIKVSTGSLQSVALIVVPASLGCALYADIGVAIFSKVSFGPARDNLLVLSAFLFLVYFSMPLGTCVVAAGRNREWTLVQCLCVVVSALLDPLLVPWFQTRMGNGGLGLCVAAVISELLVVSCGIMLTPRGIFTKKLMRSLSLALVAGVAMAAASWLMRSITPFVSAPIAVVVYAVVLWATGGVEPQHVQAIRGFIEKKLSRSS